MKSLKKTLVLGSLGLVSVSALAMSASCHGPNGGGQKDDTPELEGVIKVNEARYYDEAHSAKMIHPTYDSFSELTGSFANNAKEKYFQSVINAQYSPFDRPYDVSASFGSQTLDLQDSTTSAPVTTTYYGRAEFETKTETDDITGIKSEETFVKRPTFSKNQLSLASAVVLVVDGVEKVYDNDQAELAPAPEKDGYYKSALLPLFSKNPKSVNSKEFQEDLAKTTKLSFKIKKGVKWVDKTGAETKYELTANDFFVSYMRTNLHSTAFRWSETGGGSKEIDEATKNTLLSKESTKEFLEKNNYTNGYLLDLFSVDRKALFNKEKTVTTDADGNTYLNFYTANNKPTNLSNFLEWTIDSYEISPAPSQYIEENKNNPDVFYSQASLSTDQLSEYHDEVLKAKGLAKDTGWYWYGRTIDNTLFVGPYYAVGYNSQTQKETIKLNKYFANQEFIKDHSRITEFSRKYQTQAIPPEQFTEQSWNLYNSGDTASIAYSSLSSQHAADVNKNPKSYGLTFGVALQKSQTARDFLTMLTPYVKGESLPFAYSDAYSLLMWGMTKEQILNGAASENPLFSSYVGLGAKFNQIINAALNLQEFANQNNSNKVIQWNTIFAPDTKITDNPNQQEGPLTVRDAWLNVVKQFVIDPENNSRLTLVTDKGKTLGEYIKPTDSDSTSKGGSDIYQSAAFEFLKNEMKKLLDKFYEQHPELVGEKVANELGQRWTNPGDKYLNSSRGLIEIINQLDSRLEFSMKDFNGSSDEWRKMNNGTNTSYSWLGWGYDYDGIGSGFDSLSSIYSIIPLFMVAQANSEFMAKLEGMYPETAVAAKEFAKYVKENDIKFSLTPEQVEHLNPTLLSYDFSNVMNSRKLVDGKLVPLTDEEQEQYTDLGTITSKFWLDYQNKSTKDHLIKLANEISNTMGIVLDSSGWIAKEQYAKWMYNPNYMVPTTLGRPTILGNYQVINIEQKAAETTEQK